MTGYSRRANGRGANFRRTATACCGAALLLATGCGRADRPRFVLNFEGKERTAADREERKAMQTAHESLSTALTAAFGTPDDPFVFPELGLDADKIRIASGPYSSDQHGKQRGLYRQHCAHCHGITGDGAGPTAAFLNPYPRDYRRGIFKYKSTERTAKPTHADLAWIIKQGITGTAMPAFGLLPESEVEALAEYVRYLAVRGETELLLYDMLVDQGEPLPDDPGAARTMIVELASSAAQAWQTAETQVITPPEKPEVDLAAGKKLFLGPVAQCSKCHGPTGLGDGGEESFDDWNKDKRVAGLDPKTGEDVKGNTHLYTLAHKQTLNPRNLRLGIYRGGRRPVDLYRRIYAGINGAPMPEAPKGEKGLKPEDIWHLVDYVRSLPYEKQSQPVTQQASVSRAVN